MNREKQCDRCMKWFMSINQKEHHVKNEDRLCSQKMQENKVEALSELQHESHN